MQTRWVSATIEKLTVWLAVGAGLVLILLAILTVVSITGRSLVWAGLAPIPGDFELVEIGTAVAVFGFLPYCHLRRGHVTVDILVNRLPIAASNFLTSLGDFLISVIALVVAWRLWFGFLEKLSYADTSMILGAPLWVGYGLCFAGAVWMVVVAIHVLVKDMVSASSGTPIQ